jgi:hypothetical protein
MQLVWIITVGTILAACSSPSKQEQQRELIKPVNRLAAIKKIQDAQRLYDDEGRLLASSEVVSGLRLPRGLKARLSSAHRSIYQTEVPLEKLHWYLNGHLQISQVRRVSGATTYIAAIPREATGSSVRLDVSVGPDYPNFKQNIIEISEVPEVSYDGKPPMTRFLEHVQYEKKNAY